MIWYVKKERKIITCDRPTWIYKLNKCLAYGTLKQDDDHFYRLVKCVDELS